MMLRGERLTMRVRLTSIRDFLSREPRPMPKPREPYGLKRTLALESLTPPLRRLHTRHSLSRELLVSLILCLLVVAVVYTLTGRSTKTLMPPRGVATHAD